MPKLETFIIGVGDRSGNGVHPSNGDSPLPSPQELGLNNITEIGAFPVRELYELLAQNPGLTHQDQIAFLHPGLKGRSAYDQAWNETLGARNSLKDQLKRGGNTVVVGEMEDEAGRSRYTISRNGHENGAIGEVVAVNSSTPTSENAKPKPLEIDPESPLYHPETIGEEGSSVRILANLLFPKSLANRAIFRGDLEANFIKTFLQLYPTANQRIALDAFKAGLILLDLETRTWESAYQVSEKGPNRNQLFVKIEPLDPEIPAISRNPHYQKRKLIKEAREWEKANPVVVDSAPSAPAIEEIPQDQADAQTRTAADLGQLPQERETAETAIPGVERILWERPIFSIKTKQEKRRKKDKTKSSFSPPPGDLYKGLTVAEQTFPQIVISSNPRDMDIQANGARTHLPYGQQKALLEHLMGKTGRELNPQDLIPRGSGISVEVAITNFVRLKEVVDNIKGMKGAVEIVGTGKYRRFIIHANVLMV